MRFTRRAGRGWASVTAVTAVMAAGFLGGISQAGATSVAYVDGNEVWDKTLDGKHKTRLSSGEGDWREAAAADSGDIIGVRLESGKIAQLSKMQLWGENGKVLSQGPLPYKYRAWSSYAAPIGLDLSSDGYFAAYGYSGYTGVVPSASFYFGHHVVNADNKVLNVELELDGEWPSMFGRRAVVAQGSIIAIQPDGTGPFGPDYDSLVDVSGTGLELARADVSADARLMTFDLQAEEPADDRIGIVSISGVAPPVEVGASVDCFLPTVGDASDSTLSQDGRWISWTDAEGVKVAGVPTTLADPCQFSSPPVVITPTGKSPSIGGADFFVLKPPKLGVTLPAKLKAGDLASPAGVAVTVTVPGRGKVKVTGSVPKKKLKLKGSGRVTVVTGSAVAGKAGPIKVRLRIVKKYRKYKARLKGATVLLKIGQGSTSITRNVKLR